MTGGAEGWRPPETLIGKKTKQNQKKKKKKRKDKKSTADKDKEAKSTEGGRKKKEKGRWSNNNNNNNSNTKRIRCVTGALLEFLSSDPVLAPIVKTPRGDGVCEEGPETRSWSNTQRKRRFFFPARPLGEDAAVLRSEHPFSDWLLEGAQGRGWRHRAPRCLQWHRVNSSLQTPWGSRGPRLCAGVTHKSLEKSDLEEFSVWFEQVSFGL